MTLLFVQYEQSAQLPGAPIKMGRISNTNLHYLFDMFLNNVRPSPSLLVCVLALMGILASDIIQQGNRLIETLRAPYDSTQHTLIVMNHDWQRNKSAIVSGLRDSVTPDSRAFISFTGPFTTHLPVVFKPAINLKRLITKATVTLPHPLATESGNWCIWGGCTLSPRLYHEPLNDGRTLVGWTDSSGNGYVSLISNGSLQQTVEFQAQSVRGMVVHNDGKFAVLLWNPVSKTMWLSKHELSGNEIWKTNVTGSLTIFDSGIGDSRLAYGNGLYATYFAVFGVSGWVEGHNGDQLTYVDSTGVIQPGGWDWGCSHSMAELISYHPILNEFIPICSSDCYASKGILISDNQIVYPCDGNCGGQVSAQLGQLALSDASWKLVFNALNRPCCEGRGIALATIDGSHQSSYVWLTDTNGDYERDPVLARLGSSLQTNRYVVGWKTINDDAYWLGVVDGSGHFLEKPQEVSSAGITWGNRDDSFRTRADGRVSWVQGNSGSINLNLFLFDGSAYIP